MINELSITIKLHNANSWRVRKSTGCCFYYYTGEKVEAESKLEGCYDPEMYPIRWPCRVTLWKAEHKNSCKTLCLISM